MGKTCAIGEGRDERMTGANLPPADQILRGRLLWFSGDPETDGDAAMRYVEDGALALARGIVVAVGAARDVLAGAPRDVAVSDHRPHLILPGFIDPHIHFPQTQVIASYGAQLMDWLNRYTFVEEQKFADSAHCAGVARFFLDELLRNGTTSAAVYGSVHIASVEAFFAESARRGTRMAAGKVMMDRNAPPALTDTPQRGYDESKALIGQWHGVGRQSYAISPRFAVTSSPTQLEAAGALAREFPDCLVQTHISENALEIAAVAQLFPDCADYTAVYEKYGLLGAKSLMGHCLHLSESEKRRFADAGACAVFCPTSNLFLGSGLFDWASIRDPRRPIRLAVATDVGGGTSYSMLQTMAEAYKALQLRGQSLTARAALHAMTRGNARALGFANAVGSFEVGCEGDAVVLDSRATPAMRHRMAAASTLDEELFILIAMGDDRAVAETYVMGRPSKPRAATA